MEIVRIQFLDGQDRWQTAECSFPRIKLEIGYQNYSASIGPNHQLDIVDSEGKIYHGKLQRNTASLDADELGYEAAQIK